MDPDDRGYHADHTWAKAEDDMVRVGITDHAQAQLSTIVYVDLPAKNSPLRAGRAFGEIESTKTVSDLVAPLSGTVSDHNAALADDPELVNHDPYGQGWLILVRPHDPGELDTLLTAEQYQQRRDQG